MTAHELLAFLQAQGPQIIENPSDPPDLPASAEGLPALVYIEAAIRYVENYPFQRNFYKYKQKTRQRITYRADAMLTLKARNYLHACIEVNRAGVAPLSSDPTAYDPADEQLQFIVNQLIPQRWRLEELASEILVLVEFGASFVKDFMLASEIVQVRSNTRTASAVATPVHTGETRNHSIVDKVSEDHNSLMLRSLCLLSRSVCAILDAA